jgi:hypothetical protein
MKINKPKLTKDELVNRIAEDVGLCWYTGSKDVERILCDLLYYTNLNSKWYDDVVQAIKGVCPNYFKRNDEQ